MKKKHNVAGNSGMPLSANLLKLESLILPRAKRATNRNSVATEQRIWKKKFWHRNVRRRIVQRRNGGSETYPTRIYGLTAKKYNTLCADNFNYENKVGLVWLGFFNYINFYEKAILMGELSVGELFCHRD